MNETKHTPGPWLQDNRKDRYGFLCGVEITWREEGPVVREQARRRIDVAKVLSHHDEQTTRANAALIAAAPVLLTAAIRALAYFEQCVMSCDEDEVNPEAEALRAAIAKAKGEVQS